MRTLRRNVFTESLPSNGYTRHNIYKFGNVRLACFSLNYLVNITTYEKIVLNIKAVSFFSTIFVRSILRFNKYLRSISRYGHRNGRIFSCKMAVKIVDLYGN
jgi:hypothetical protein